MYFMNEHDIDDARRRWADHPVLGPATQTLSNLRDAVNANSDGWPYWKAPGNAAKQLMMLIQGDGTYRYLMPPRDDVDRAALTKALRPLKAFRTRQGLDFEIVETVETVEVQSADAEPSSSWRVLDRNTGTTVDRSSEGACLEWVRAQDADDVARGRYRVIPPAGQVTAECPDCGRRFTMSLSDWSQGAVLCTSARLNCRNGLFRQVGSRCLVSD